MAFKEEIPVMTQTVDKNEVLQNYQQRLKELSKRQREYKKTVSLRLKTRAEQILERSYLKTINRLKAERNDLRAQLWVANGQCHRSNDQRDLEQIECHVECQQRMGKQIKDLKIRISNMEREIGRVDKQIYELNRKTVPDSQHQDYVARARKRANLMQRHLEIGSRRECGFTAENAVLRGEMNTMLDKRLDFHDTYAKLVQRLNVDKKYMLELVEFLCQMYDSAVEIDEKMLNSAKKTTKEREHAKFEMQSIMRNLTANELASCFSNCKNHTRTLADLQPSEYHRRAVFKQKHVHKITVYNNVLSKLFDFSSAYDVQSVIQNYEHHKSLYYSYFSLANELSFHITLVQNTANRLFAEVRGTQIRNRARVLRQKSKLEDLEIKLEETKKRNVAVNHKLDLAQKNLYNIFNGVKDVFNLCSADATPLQQLLGNHSFIDLKNVHGFLKIFEARILHIVRSVYVKERNDKNWPYKEKYTVRHLFKFQDRQTNLKHIVLAQQCPECAEGETCHTDGGFVAVGSIEEAREVLMEKVKQPEMQYRLHSVSECRLLRSRLLAAQRYA